jgi:hypothetical protein
MLAMAITEMSARNLVVITQSVEKRSDCSQWLCDEAGNVIEIHEHASDSSHVATELVKRMLLTAPNPDLPKPQHTVIARRC